MRYRMRYTKPTITASIIAATIGIIISGIYGLNKIIVSLPASLITLACSALAGYGLSMTHKRRHSAAFIFIAASIGLAVSRFAGIDSSLVLCVSGACFAFASMNNFQLINLGTPMPENVDELHSGEIMNKQDTWAELVSKFISRYGIAGYYGYVFTSMACLFLHGAWIFAPAIWEGHSREFWAIIAAGSLSALSFLLTESMRRNMTNK